MFLLGTPAFAQDELAVEPAEMIESVAQFLEENVDENFVNFLGVDLDETQKVLDELKERFEGEYVFDLSAFQETAGQVLPLLEQFEDTAPYASWLKMHLDYFEMAEKLHEEANRNLTNAAPLPAPSSNAKRQVWFEVVEEKPLPPLAYNRLLQLKQIFTEEGVPPELVWLAEVESSFDAKARSPAGAVGLFQLMPVTARSLDLSVGFLRDERLHPEKNARAAARYLRQLYRRFGDWRLTLAAYNGGQSRVASLLKKHEAKSFDAIANHLPTETQMFVPKVEAVIRKREGCALDDLQIATE